jgi:VanZ family protein
MPESTAERKPPSNHKGKKFNRWLHVVLCTIIVYLTLPVGPVIRDYFYNTFGKLFVIYVVAVILASGLIMALVHIFRRWRQRGFSLSQLVWFLVVGYLYWFALRRTFKIPIESIHFVEYGILSLLIFRALVKSYNENFIFFASFLLTALLGMIDEYIQWFLPNRVGAMRDIIFNSASGGLVQLLLWKSIRPDGLVKGFPARSFRLVAVLAVLNLILLGIFTSLVSDFGSRIRDPEAGTFYTRMTREEIARRDSLQWNHYSDALDASLAVPYRTFLEETKDPFLYEMRIHIFRRDRHFDEESYRVSCCEEKILQKYFGRTLSNSEYAWTQDRTELCNEVKRDCTSYRSPVSQELIVKFRERDMWIFIVLLSAAFLFLGTRKSLTSRMDKS